MQRINNKSPMQFTVEPMSGVHRRLIVALVLAALVMCLEPVPMAEAYPLNGLNLAPFNELNRKHPVTLEIENPEEVLSVLDNLMQNILVGIDFTQHPMQQDKSGNANKRGIDLGLSRGFSGSQAAKHLMGMSAASFANGPGRRRK